MHPLVAALCAGVVIGTAIAPRPFPFVLTLVLAAAATFMHRPAVPRSLPLVLAAVALSCLNATLRHDPHASPFTRVEGAASGITPLDAVAGSVRTATIAAASPLSADAGAVLRGLTIGDTTGFSDELTDRFRRAGLGHLVAVSGSNVAIVIGAVLLVMARAGLWVRLTAAALALSVYVVIVGPEPSVLRAAAMGAIVLLALIYGERPNTLDALAVAVLVVLLAQPHLLLSVGLHLSVAATLGIVLWAPALSRRFHRLARPVRLVAGATIAAQIAVLPISVVTFEAFSVVGPLANVAAVPASAPATVLGLAAGLVGLVHGGAGALVARTAEPFCAWIVWVAAAVTRPALASVEVPAAAGIVLAVPVLMAAGIALRHRPAASPESDVGFGTWHR